MSDTLIATATPDSLLHHTHVINIWGDSYQLKDRRKIGDQKVPDMGPGAYITGKLKWPNPLSIKSITVLTIPKRSFMCLLKKIRRGTYCFNKCLRKKEDGMWIK